MEHGREAPLQIVVNWHGVVATVTATGELDIATATPLTQQLLVVAAEHPERVALDLRQRPADEPGHRPPRLMPARAG